MFGKKTYTHVVGSDGKPRIVDQKTLMPKAKAKPGDFDRAKQPKTLREKAARNLWH